MQFAKKNYSGPERRVGASERRIGQQKPCFPLKGFGSHIPHYKRKSFAGKKTVVADQRIGPKDRRRK